MRTKILLALLAVVLAFVGVLWHFAHTEMTVPARLAMRGTLRNLAAAESVYFDANHRFTSDVSELESAAQFRAEAGVSVTIDRADSTAWHASATHRRLAEVCTFGGPGSGERQPSCR